MSALSVQELRRIVESKRFVWRVPEDEEFQRRFEREIEAEALNPYAGCVIYDLCKTVNIPILPDQLDPTVPIIVFDIPTDAVYLDGKVVFVLASRALPVLLKKYGKVIICNRSNKTYMVTKEDIIRELKRKVKRTRDEFDKEYYGKVLEYLTS